MTAMVPPPLTKPVRVPKERKPLQRSKKPIARKKAPAKQRQTPRAKAGHAADLKWAKAIRESGPCAALHVLVLWHGIPDESDNPWDFEPVPQGYRHARCFGDMTAAHIVSRRYLATRRDKTNGVPLCVAAHGFFTAHPLAWEAFVIQTIGQERYDALKAKAQGRTE